MTTAALNMRPETAAIQARGRRMLALIAALLLLPVVVAVLLWGLGWQPARQINHGELLATAGQVARKIGDSRPQSAIHNLQKNGGHAALDEPASAPWHVLSPGIEMLSGRWLLALAVPAECTTDCLAQLQLARRVQVALNKNMTRLQRGLIGPQLQDAASIEGLRARWPDLAIARASAATWLTLGGAELLAPQLFLIDPNGQLVLRYSADPDPKGVRQDVERLLKFSWLG